MSMKEWLAVFAATSAAIGALAAIPVQYYVGDPQTWAVDDAGISNFYGRVKGVEPIWIEGEPLAGKPTRVFAWWGLPKGASSASKVPAMVLVHGGGGTAYAKWVKTWNDRGYAAIAMDTCGKAPRGERGGRPHPEHEWSGPSGWGSSVAQVGRPLKDQWTYHAIAAIMRAHSFIRGRPEVDAERTGITGISWGGYLTSIAMCVDRRFKFAAPVYGCGFYELNPEWDAMNADPALRRKWFELWDAKNYLQSAAGSGGVACPVLWCDGTNDRWYTLEMLKRSCDLLGPSVPLTLSIKLRMPHGHPPYGDPKEITACADHYLKGGPRPVKIENAHVDGSRFVADFSEGGMKVVGAEFLWTCATNVVLRDREWLSRPADEFDVAGGRCAAVLPQGVVMFLMSLTTADGLKFSTGPFEREGVSHY